MKIREIVKRVNHKLAGEQLPYRVLRPFLDEVIDDINNKLNSTFPSFSSLGDGIEFLGEAEYNYFPEEYIRSVLIPGTAYKFYLMDEEGENVAEAYGMDYNNNLFYMVRDYIEAVPVEYQKPSRGSVVFDENMSAAHTPFYFGIWR